MPSVFLHIMSMIRDPDGSGYVGARPYVRAALLKKGITAGCVDTNDLLIKVPTPEAARAVRDVLRDFKDMEWEFQGPYCPHHPTKPMVSAQVQRDEVWKCLEVGCGASRFVRSSEFLTAREFSAMALYSLPTGRGSWRDPPDPLRVEKSEGKLEDSPLYKADYAELEKATLYVYQQLLLTPRNFRQIENVEAAAELLAQGIPVAFETKPEIGDPLVEVVTKARNKAEDGQIIVQFEPMPHVLPNQALALAADLKNAAKNAATGLVKSFDWKAMAEEYEGLKKIAEETGTPIMTSAQFEKDWVRKLAGDLPNPWPTVVQSGSADILKAASNRMTSSAHEQDERARIEAAKATMLGTTSKEATVLDIAAKKQESTPWMTAKWNISDSNQNREFPRQVLGEWQDVEKPNLQQIPRQMAKSIGFGMAYGDPFLMTVVREMLRERNMKAALLRIAYGGRPEEEKVDAAVAHLQKKNEEMEKLLRQKLHELDELGGANHLNKSALKNALEREALLKDQLEKATARGDTHLLKSAGLEELKKQFDKFIRVVAGLNLQDQSLSTQREIREALDAAMKALKGE